MLHLYISPVLTLALLCPVLGIDPPSDAEPTSGTDAGVMIIHDG